MIFSILTEGLLYGGLSLSVYLSFRLLNFPDLTIDGSFPLGAVIAASMFASGYSAIAIYPFVFFAGVLAGMITAAIHNKFSVPPLLAGIITMTMLYSVNIRILGNRSNFPLLRIDTAISRFTNFVESSLPELFQVLSKNGIRLSYVLFVIILMIAVVIYLLYTRLGLVLRAMGDNEKVVISYGYSVRRLKLVGIGLANGIAGLIGALVAQNQGFADVGMGRGVIIGALVSVLIGEFIFKTDKIYFQVLRVFIGTILFQSILFLGRYYGYTVQLIPTDLQLLVGLTIIFLLAIQQLRKRNA